jgi:hypothetical protein
MAQIMVDPPPPLTKWRSDLDPALGGICGRALAKPPQDRFPSMLAFATALDEYLKTPVRPMAATLPSAQPTQMAVKSAAQTAEPLDEQNAATLFNEMAAQQIRLGGTLRPHGPSRLRLRRRRHFRLPEWLIPLAGSLAVLAVGVFVVGFFFRQLSARRTVASTPDVPPIETPHEENPPDWAEAPAEFRNAFEWLQSHPDHGESVMVLRRWAQASELRNTVPPGPALAAGKYLLVVKHDWDNGPLLIRRSDSRLWLHALDIGIAAQAKNATAAEKLAAADAWWDLAASQGDLAKPILGQAREWYRAAVSHLPTGPDHHRALDRMSKEN